MPNKPDVQYLFQTADGNRTPVTWVQYQLAIGKGALEIIGETTVKVCCLPEHVKARPAKPLRYGSSRRQRECFDPSYAKAGYARVNELRNLD